MTTRMYDTGYQLSNERRELYFKIIEDIKLTDWIAPRLHFLDSGFPPHQLDKALRWLIASNYTGKRFIDWFNLICEGSNLQMHAMLLRVATNEKVERIIAGKNFRK